MANFNNIIELFETTVKNNPEKIAFTFLSFDSAGKRQEKNLTYKEVQQQAKAIAYYMKKKNFRPNDIAIIFSTQKKDAILSLYATLYAGGIFIILPPPIDEQKKSRFASVLSSVKPKMILCNREVYVQMRRTFADTLFQTIFKNKKISEQPTFIRFIFYKISKWIVKYSKGFELFNIDKCLDKTVDLEAPQITPDQTATILYTSGSMTSPKGVIISHKNIVVSAINLLDITGVQGATFLSFLPLFHTVGLIPFVFSIVYLGSRSVIMSPMDFQFSPLRWIQALSDYKANFTAAPNSAYHICASYIQPKDLEHIDLTHLTMALSGGEVIHKETYLAFYNIFKNAHLSVLALSSGYGASETTCGITVDHIDDEFHYIDVSRLKLADNIFEPILKIEAREGFTNIVSAGKLSRAFAKILIVDPANFTELPNGRIGEIFVQGDVVSSGYWKNEKATQETFKNKIKGHDGYFYRSGDLGCIYEDRLYITGREKNLIIVNGKNHYPDDITQSLILRVPMLASTEIACFSITHAHKEKLVCVIESAEEDPERLKESIPLIQDTLRSLFGFSAFDIMYVKRGSLDRTDVRKIQIPKTRQEYLNSKLQRVFSLKEQTLQLVKKDIEKKAITEDHATEEVKHRLTDTIRKNAGEIGEHITLDFNSGIHQFGLDSIVLIDIYGKIEREFGIKIPPEVFWKQGTLLELAQTIKTALEDETYLTSLVEISDYEADAKLDESIVPSGRPFKFSKEKYNVFLTGSTGFVGVHILNELLKREDVEKIYCLVRAQNRDRGFRRIKDNLSFYSLWNEELQDKIVPVCGDLTKQSLGIEKQEYDTLTEIIDIIYHSGAFVNFVMPYSDLRESNIHGTSEMLKFACAGKSKLFHFISTISVYDCPENFGRQVEATENPQYHKDFFLDYSGSKWAGEQLVNQAKSRGLAVTIFRPGEVTGDSVKGTWKVSDLYSRFIVACMNFDCAPDIDMFIYAVPADFVAKSIAALSFMPSSINQHFNIISDKPPTIRTIVENANKTGYSIDLIPWEDWEKMLIDDCEKNSKNALKPLLSLIVDERPGNQSFKDRYNRGTQIDIDNSKLVNQLKESGITCHDYNEDLLTLFGKNFYSFKAVPFPPGGFTINYMDALDISSTDIYGDVLCELGEKHDDVVALTADLAKSTKIGKFLNKFPERFFNMGIAEQNMVGAAAGLALAGFTPFVSSFSVFLSMRSAEMVRTDICYQNLNVKIIGTHSGISFGQAGSTHHCNEDIGIMRTFPNMTVIVPADGFETGNAVRAAYEKKGPVYIRINRGMDPTIYKDTDFTFEIGKAIKLHSGSDLTVIACGYPVFGAYHAAVELEKEEGIQIRVLNMHTIKPIDKEAILLAIQATKQIMTFEEHNVVGGLGTAVADIIAESGLPCKFKKVGIPDQFAKFGDPSDLYKYYHLDMDGIKMEIHNFLKSA